MTSGDRAVPARSVRIVIGCDTDPDREGLVGPLPPGGLQWRGVEEGIPALKTLLHGIHDARGREPVFTWLLRADAQVHALCGEYALVVGAHGALLRRLEDSGDELGWHPHFWRRTGRDGGWMQELDDVDWQLEMLRSAHAALHAALPNGVRSVRMGWNYHNLRTFAALDALGVQVEFSALPGMRTLFADPPAHRENLFDWMEAPRLPYHAARTDHRRRAGAGEPAFAMLEVPTFVSGSRLWSLASGLQLARKTRRLAPFMDALSRPTYWINLTARPHLFRPLVDSLRRALARRDVQPLVFATYFHPDELLPNRSALYDLPSVRTNLLALLRACEEAGVPAEFLQARELVAPAPLSNDVTWIAP
jgi:hypothetical protein